LHGRRIYADLASPPDEPAVEGPDDPDELGESEDPEELEASDEPEDDDGSDAEVVSLARSFFADFDELRLSVL
jgi:hypothetical protein